MKMGPVLPILCPFDATVDLDRAPVKYLPLSLRECGPASGRFRNAEVRVAWRGDALFIFADLMDDEPWTSATEDHQRLWDLGDVFEIFLRDPGELRYREFHISPKGHRLQISFPSREQRESFEEHIVREKIFDFRVGLREGGWSLSARVPWLEDCEIPLAGREALVSFSRYDRSSDGSPPVYSSTSIHEVLDFHRQEDWTRIRFGPADVA